MYERNTRHRRRHDDFESGGSGSRIGRSMEKNIVRGEGKAGWRARGMGAVP